MTACAAFPRRCAPLLSPRSPASLSARRRIRAAAARGGHVGRGERAVLLRDGARHVLEARARRQGRRDAERRRDRQRARERHGRCRPLRHVPVPHRGRARRAGRADRPYVEQRAQESAERGAVGDRARRTPACRRAISRSSRARRSASRAAPAASRTSSGLLKQVGLTPDDVTLVNTAPSNMATALANKDADVIASWEPWPSAALTKVPGSYKVIYGGCKSCYDAGTVVTTKTAIADKPKALEPFILGYAQAQAWTRANRDEAAKISTRWIPGMDAETLTLALKNLPLDVRLSKNTIDGFRAVQHSAARARQAHPAGIRSRAGGRQPLRRRGDEGRSVGVRGPEGNSGRASACRDARRTPRAVAATDAHDAPQPAVPVLGPAHAAHRRLLRRSLSRPDAESRPARARGRRVRQRVLPVAAVRAEPDVDAHRRAIRTSRNAGPTTTTCAPTPRRGCTRSARPAIGPVLAGRLHSMGPDQLHGYAERMVGDHSPELGRRAAPRSRRARQGERSVAREPRALRHRPVGVPGQGHRDGRGRVRASAQRRAARRARPRRAVLPDRRLPAAASAVRRVARGLRALRRAACRRRRYGAPPRRAHPWEAWWRENRDIADVDAPPRCARAPRTTRSCIASTR